MVTIYWFALITGGGMLAASMLGDLFGADIDDVDTGGDGDGAKLLSLRNITYFLFGAGATGVALHSFTPLGAGAVAGVAGTVGAAAATAAALLLNYVKRTESGERQAEDSFVGCMGRITLPFGPDHTGRVLIRRGEREYELRAQPFDSESTAARIGTGIIVVEMDGGTALVTPVGESLPAAGADA